MSKFWILNEKKKMIKASLEEWGRWFELDERIVAQEYIGEYFISTVFLGIDHGLNFSEEARPVVFESLVFGSEREALEQARCCTWDEAVAMHSRFVAMYTDKVREAKEAAAALLEGHS